MQWPIPPFPTKATALNAPNSEDVLESSSTANTKGSWVTLGTTLTSAASWINLACGPISSTTGDRSILLDLAIGGAGSETIVLSNLVMGFRNYHNHLIPLHLPAGATLRGRISCGLSGSNFVFTRTTAYHGEPDSGLTVPGRITTYGAVPASSSGTTVTPSGTSNVMGSWAELTSSTTAPIHALMVAVQSSSTTIPSFREYLIDIGVGPSGQETVIVPHWKVAFNSPYVFPQSPELCPLSVSLPAGVRLSARCLVVGSTNTTAVEAAVYGLTY